MKAMALTAAENIEHWVRVNQNDVTPHILAQQIEHGRTIRAYAEDRLLGPRKWTLTVYLGPIVCSRAEYTDVADAMDGFAEATRDGYQASVTAELWAVTS